MKKNNIKELSIQVNLNGLSFCILNRSNNTIEVLTSIAFENKLTPFETLNRLKKELSSNTSFSDNFNAVTVIHQNELTTIVPKEYYDENQKVDYLKFNAKILKTDFITHDSIAINNSINVYIPYVNINNYIFETFGEFIYKHSSTLLIDSILQKSDISEGPVVYINVNTATFELLVFNEEKLQLSNVFEYHSKEDFIYYVLFVFEQLALDSETAKVKLSGSISKEDDIYNILYTYVRHIEFIDININYSFTDTIKKDNLHSYYLILNAF
ncbi:DUF3822 family protein [Winogradskyella sp. PE311]|uniref:DUF3822 family protein n=1 Tax=Winogradskyella sp. PE311 TaxID=3366943 RepID=UPI00397FFFEF